MLLPKFKCVPKELKKYDQWVVWKYVHRQGQKRPEKIPYDPISKKTASVKDPETWHSFATIEKSFNINSYDGIGFVLTKDDPFVGIDLDDCLIKKNLGPEAKEIYKRLNSYSERSPSKNGLRIFIKGELPPGYNRKNNIEIYDHGRYLSLTGHHHRVQRRTAKKIQNRQKEIELIHRKFFNTDLDNQIEATVEHKHVTMKKRNVLLQAQTHFQKATDRYKKFSTLFKKGDWQSMGYASQSEADLALCNLLARLYEGDPKYIDGGFRASRLMRDKWDRKDYREATINKATTEYRKNHPSEIEKIETWKEIQQTRVGDMYNLILQENDLMKFEKEPVLKIIEPWLEMPSISLIYGSPGSGKTIFALSLLKHIAAIKSLGDWKVMTPVKSLFFDAELPLNKLKHYCSALKHLGEDKKPFMFWSARHMSSKGFPLPNVFDQYYQKIIGDYLIDNGFELWVLDNLFSASGEEDMKTAETFGLFNQWLMDLRSKNVSTIVVDHANKSGESFGSVRKTVPMDIVLRLAKGPSTQNTLTLKLKFEKARIDLNDKSQLKDLELYYKIDSKGNGIWSFKDTAPRKRIYEILCLVGDGIIKQTDIGIKLGISQSAVSQKLTELKRQRYIDKNNKLTEAGNKLITVHSGL